MHGSLELHFQIAVLKFFRQQGRRVIAGLQGVTHPLPHDILAAVDWSAEHHKFMSTVIRPQLLRCAITGAVVQSGMLRAGKSLSSFSTKASDDEEIDEDVEHELPPEMLRAIRNDVEQNMRSPWWDKVEPETRDGIEQSLKDGFDEGFSERSLARAITERTGGEIARNRALKIGRTESTSMANAGQAAVIDQIAQQDRVRLGREWLAVGDSDTRADHLAANGQRVGHGEMFIVGGERAPYPGHFSLSAEQRTNCRCTFISTGATEGD